MAVNTSGNAPVCVAVPPSTRVAGVNVTPVGSVPVCDTVGVGKPVVVTVNVPGVPTVKVVLAALVIAGACWTVSVKAWTAFGSAPLAAVKVNAYDPAVPAAGVPLSVAGAVAVVRERDPAGSATPVRVIAGVGNPVVVTVKVPGDADRERRAGWRS